LNSLFAVAAVLWLLAAVLAAARCLSRVSGLALVLGCIAVAIGTLESAGAAATLLPGGLFGEKLAFHITAEAGWLFGFGCCAAAVVCAVSTPARFASHGWTFGAAAALIGAMGVFGIEDGVGFLIAWEIMGFGGAIMLLSERLSPAYGKSTLFMLALLEVGSVALILVVIVLGLHAGTLDFLRHPGEGLSPTTAVALGALLIVGFGAKLGLLPFFEWFPNAYGAGSGATGALLSGVVLNAAFFGLGRGLLDWLPTTATGAQTAIGMIAVIIGVASAILTILYAFQEDDWRALLSFSSAENASIAVAMLGAALLFRGDGKPDLAVLAWCVALLHLAGHSLAKSGLFLTADAVYRATGSYLIAHSALLQRTPILFGVGALFSAMSLAAMPPQAGFVSEWFVFQTLFQGFHLENLGGRLVMALAGAGLALTAAVALATFVKAFGIGLLGKNGRHMDTIPIGLASSVGLLGLAVLAFAVGLPFYLGILSTTAVTHFGIDASRAMVDGLLLVPLTSRFAFISPTLLVIVMPLLALLPAAFVIVSQRRTIRRSAVWYGGLRHDPIRVSTTALTFSNAMRTFYSFIYRPVASTERETSGARYFVRRLTFTHDVAPIFGPLLFGPATRVVSSAARRFRSLQSGSLNFYLALIGLLLVFILAIALV
jgi:formate hydrogenlyase subunit 3/multisubunit Na+/H+ antiporter MnhD subunit